MSQKKVLLVDSTKFDRVESAYFARIQDFDTIVSDSNLSREYIALGEELGVEVILA